MGRHDIGKDGNHFLSRREEMEIESDMGKRFLILHRRTIRTVCKYGHEITVTISLHVVALGVLHYSPIHVIMSLVSPA